MSCVARRVGLGRPLVAESLRFSAQIVNMLNGVIDRFWTTKRMKGHVGQHKRLIGFPGTSEKFCTPDPYRLCE